MISKSHPNDYGEEGELTFFKIVRSELGNKEITLLLSHSADATRGHECRITGVKLWLKKVLMIHGVTTSVSEYSSRENHFYLHPVFTLLCVSKNE